jgi:EmrB/QacA subfamily drug resistance transporter
MYSQKGKKTLILIFSLASFLVPFTVSSLNVALPAIGAAFSLDAITLGWITTAYMLTASVCILPFGKIADIYGRKRIFLIGTVLFITGSMCAALSISGEMLIMSRIIQGLGGAMVFATSVAIVTCVFPPGERGRALGIITATIYAGLSLGPVIGGYLTQHYGWPSLFLFNIPIALLVIILLTTSLHEEWREIQENRFDVAGLILYAITLTGTMYGLATVPSFKGFIFIGSGCICGLIFILWEKRLKSPFLDLTIFQNNRVFLFSNIAAMINYSVLFAVALLVSLTLQYNRGLDPSTTGLILLSQPLVQTIVSPIAGNLSDTRDPGFIATMGMGCTAAGLLILMISLPSQPVHIIVTGLAILGLGYGLFSSPNTNAIMSSVHLKYLGLASGMVATMRAIGQLISMAVTMMIFSMIMGTVQITPLVYDQLMMSSTIILSIFVILSIFGIFSSYARGTVHTGEDSDEVY